MNNSDGKKPGKGCLISIVILVLLVLSALFSGTENEYEKAGKEFSTWTKEDPRTWTDTEKQYFNDFWEWADQN